jgi:hypothetical protein
MQTRRMKKISSMNALDKQPLKQKDVNAIEGVWSLLQCQL